MFHQTGPQIRNNSKLNYFVLNPQPLGDKGRPIKIYTKPPQEKHWVTLGIP